ncbi:hypothetical protein CICLE_v10022826mg [Citrus x clementina]|uniref:Uncharacterized protein n=1 Tax=Citrus clementina TaxID=85681 RepID=V4TVA7_CITCL|nr:hypothetical protein CICLE_v10022826mg [Citrus x clementina]
MSSSTSEIQTEVKACDKCCNNNKVLRTSRTKENPNRRFWKCKGCGAFEWDDDWKSSECNDFRGMEDRIINKNKIDMLLAEVRKLGHQIECLSLKFQLLEQELQRRQQPSFLVTYVSQIMITVLICIIFKLCN